MNRIELYSSMDPEEFEAEGNTERSRVESDVGQSSRQCRENRDQFTAESNVRHKEANVLCKAMQLALSSR